MVSKEVNSFFPVQTLNLTQCNEEKIDMILCVTFTIIVQTFRSGKYSDFVSVLYTKTVISS